MGNCVGFSTKQTNKQTNHWSVAYLKHFFIKFVSSFIFANSETIWQVKEEDITAKYTVPKAIFPGSGGKFSSVQTYLLLDFLEFKLGLSSPQRVIVFQNRNLQSRRKQCSQNDVRSGGSGEEGPHSPVCLEIWFYLPSFGFVNSTFLDISTPIIEVRNFMIWCSPLEILWKGIQQEDWVYSVKAFSALFL